ncbi:hypothetical protein B0I35DRAFT_481231 [Stachybotrys elegans]|uniref:Nitronate monooxygenase domain-containing protein n=1 Tax=Stachybotrys elegans TaxID=80388 RepID=A0A8K0SQA8_9HYPO|nr:hypothetical protein B0I35DRAFT_481231 [Stachybotrys elegans]
MVPFQNYLPWVKAPLIANAPMAGFAGGRLASAVTLARGLGFIGVVNNMDELRENLRIATNLTAAQGASKTLPVGVGLLPFACKLEDALPVLSEYKPAVVWLFAAKELDDYAQWAEQIRAATPHTMLWIRCDEQRLHPGVFL